MVLGTNAGNWDSGISWEFSSKSVLVSQEKYLWEQVIVLLSVFLSVCVHHNECLHNENYCTETKAFSKSLTVVAEVQPEMLLLQ